MNFSKYPITYTIIIINIIVFIIFKLDPRFVVANQYDLFISGSKEIDFSSIVKITISGFTHFGFIHIFFNMYFLYVVGKIVEIFLSKINYIILYFGSLYVSGVFAIFFSDSETITIGASGALYGLLAFLIVYYYLHKNALRNYMNVSGLIALVGINVLITLLVPGISVVGHLGGFIGGVIFTFLVDKLQGGRIGR